MIARRDPHALDQPKVADFDMPLTEKEIGWFDVAVVNAPFIEIVNSLRGLIHERDQSAQWDTAHLGRLEKL